jgi:hypothetical protein
LVCHRTTRSASNQIAPNATSTATSCQAVRAIPATATATKGIVNRAHLS